LIHAYCYMQTYIIIVPFLRLGHFLINHIIWYRYWYCNTHFSHVCINWPWPNLHVRLCKYYFCWKYLLCTFKIIFFNGSRIVTFREKKILLYHLARLTFIWKGCIHKILALRDLQHITCLKVFWSIRQNACYCWLSTWPSVWFFREFAEWTFLIVRAFVY
jgi:hypothetical protein